MVPILFGSSVAQISILFDTWIASFLADGSITWLYFSDRLLEFPLGVFGIALATVILPSLSEHHARESADSLSDTLDWALRWVAVIGVPASLALVLLAVPMVTTIFHGGEFTDRDVAMTSASLVAFAPGLLGFILVKVLAPGYFARHDARTPVRIGVRALAVGMALNVVFVLVLIYTEWAPPHAGLAAATSLSGILNASMLFAGLARTRVYRPRPGWKRLFARLAAANVLMAVFLAWLAAAFGDWLAMTLWQQIGALALAVGGGAGIYFAACFATGVRPRDLRMHARDGDA
jgi:putative peptidoglycan lipid II flippase